VTGRSLATVAATAVVAAGCGSAPPPSLVQLRAQGARICAAASGRLRRIPTPRTEVGGEAFLTHAIAVLSPELRRLRGLSAPGDGADVYRAALAATAGELKALTGAVRALDRQQDPVISFRTLQQRLGPLESQADGAWQALQMPACLQR
jgi:hypothetical protein